MLDTFFEMLKNVAIFVVLAMPGFILVKTGILKQEHSSVFSKFLMVVGLPFMIVTSVVEKITFSMQTMAILGMAVAVGVLFTLAMFFVSKPVLAMEKDVKKQGMMRFCSIFSNNGFLGIPLASAVFPNNPVVIMVVIAINIVTNVMMYTVGAYVVTGNKNNMNFRKALVNPVLFAFVIGVIINLTGVVKHVPEIASYSSHFSSVVIPLSMTILGMKLGSIKISSLFVDVKTYFVSFLKLVACPLIITAITLGLRLCLGMVVDSGFVIGVFMAFAMPTAGLASAFADTYNGDNVGAVKYTLNSTILSVITIPLLYMLLLLIL